MMQSLSPNLPAKVLEKPANSTCSSLIKMKNVAQDMALFFEIFKIRMIFKTRSPISILRSKNIQIKTMNITILLVVLLNLLKLHRKTKFLYGILSDGRG